MRRSARPLLLAFAVTVTADAAIEEYAWQARIAEHPQALQRIELPLEVVLGLAREDLADIAVFNADGKRLPHSVVRAPETRREASLELSFHEFSRFQQQQSRIVTARRQARDGDAIAELETTETIPVQTRRQEFLIDLRPDDDAPRFDRIELAWTHEPDDQWLELAVQSGNEIDRLRSLHVIKRLSNHGANNANWRSIRGIPPGHRYLLLTPATRVETFEIQQVTGYYEQIDTPPTLAHRIDVERVDEDGETFYRFDYPAAIRAERLRILPGDAHSVVGGDLYATWDGVDERRRIVSGFRQHNIDSPEVRASEAITLPGRDYTRFWLSPESPLARPPRAEFEFPQYEVVFLGDGVGPYRLAWGNFASEPGQTRLDDLLDGNHRDARERGVLTQLGPIEIAGGPERLAPKPSLPWQKWLLWALLITAAVVTGRMAFRLYREMNPAGG